ncbi:MAG: sigma-70 family RNA polymerase sigma factor [Planctomycetota bacterium]|nr:sigma-70 family RNA polymerase sigma factor [Planctomycetota bacterium]
MTANPPDADDFERIALPYLDNVYRAAMVLSGKGDRADDLTQQTFLKALSQFGSFRRGSNCRAWLLKILRNTWIDGLRHLKVAGTIVPIEEAVLAGPPEPEETRWSNADDLLENFSDEQVIDALRQLPEEQRLALYLVDVEELPHDEVAGIVGVAPGTIKSRTSRARAALKEVLREHAKDLGFPARTKP